MKGKGLKVKGQNIHHANKNLKKAELALFISDKIEDKTRDIIRDNEGLS